MYINFDYKWIIPIYGAILLGLISIKVVSILLTNQKITVNDKVFLLNQQIKSESLSAIIVLLLIETIFLMFALLKANIIATVLLNCATIGCLFYGTKFAIYILRKKPQRVEITISRDNIYINGKEYR